MTERERFLATMRYQPADRLPLHLVGPWPDTLARWHREGLPEEVNGGNLHEYFGLQPLRLRNVSGQHGPWPPWERQILREDDREVVFVDESGRTVRDLKHETTLPEWLEFPVTDRESFRRVLDERYDLSDMDARFGPEWEARVAEAAASDDLIVCDGGCYYWALRSLAGVAGASYLLYDAPDLVEELFERYHALVMESLRRATARARVEVIGFGEDVAYKTSTLISPAMFRQLIAPRYRSALEFARAHGADLTWYDSDGDLKPFIPDYLELGITCLAPCEVAAGMSPADLRPRYGRELRFVGGIDKREVARGRAAIDAELERLRPVMAEGGFAPAIDHSISADISFADYCYFVERLMKTLEA